MKKRRNSVILLIVLSLSLLIFVSAIVVNRFYNKEDNAGLVKPLSLDTIDRYGYILEDRDTKLYKEKYDELKKVLQEKEIDYRKYASLISELYIIDLYTIDNKTNMYDVGALEFVYEPSQDNFALKVRDTIYKYVEDNTNGKRAQKLPQVKSIEVEDIVDAKLEIEEEKYDGYAVKLSWEYIEDLGYDTSAKVEIIKKEDKLFIIKEEQD